MQDHPLSPDEADVVTRSSLYAKPATRAFRPLWPFRPRREKNQKERIEIVSCPGPKFREELVRAGDELGVSLSDVALSCFVGLLYRHVQQNVIIVGAWDHARENKKPNAFLKRPMRRIHFDVGETATLSGIADIIARRQIEGAATVERHENLSAIFEVTDSNTGIIGTHDEITGNLSLTLVDSGGELALRLRHGGDEFPPNFMEELLAQYQIFVEQAVRAPFKDISYHTLVTSAAKTVISDPRTRIEKPRFEPVSEVFLALARRKPNAVAVRHSGQNWTYSEIERSSAALASHLSRSGIVPGDVVAVTGPRGFAVVSSLLGVFRSGGTLLTLDPNFPIERQRVMMRQARAKCLICIGEPDCVPAEEVPLLIRVDMSSGAVFGVTANDVSAPLPVLESRSPAYVFFTSGSTGTPKAILGNHEGLGHFLDWQRQAFEITENDRVSQITALSFDAVLRDVFLALTSGAILCIPNERDVLDPSAILSWMESEQITVLHVVPSLARAWLNHAPAGVARSSLRRVFFTGEPLSGVLVSRFREVFGNKTEITNFYGPTETTLIKCYHRISALEPGIQPIGRPLPNTQVLIFNRHRQLCGINEPGEIGIRTPFRTLGYLDAPDSTARAFVRNPFLDDPDDLVYLTGDSGRYRADGLLAIGGRIDNQVKIRGMRVEPGEIESVIAHHPEVKEVAVVAFDRSTTERSLAAYLVLKPAPMTLAHSARFSEVREFLKARLPEYMVPTVFIALDALPLNANGKINRRALPVPDPGAGLAAEETPDRAAGRLNRREQQLVAIWQKALGHKRVSVDDSFGELGGDSLSAISALMDMKRLGIADDVARGIFDGLTIRDIASRDADGGSSARLSYADASIFTRAVSILLVVAGHFDLIDIEGPTAGLLIVSGFSFSKFQLRSIWKTGSIKPSLHLMFRIALPTALYIALVEIVFSSYNFTSFLFVDNLISPMFNGPSFWFISLLLQNIAIISIPLSIYKVREFAAANKYAYGICMLIISWMFIVVGPLAWDTMSLYNRVPHMTVWLMAYGWCAAYSDTYWKKVLSSILLICVGVTSFGLFRPSWFLIIAGLAITWMDIIPVPLPRSVIAVINSVAGASLFIYLTHFQFNSLVHKVGISSFPVVSVIIALIGGVIVWKCWLSALSAGSWSTEKIRSVLSRRN
jgi:amino acid adenylation domain-containing protein